METSGSKEIVEELKALKREMGSFNDTLVNQRYEDLKKAFCDQIRSSAIQQCQVFFDGEMERREATSPCDIRDRCLPEMKSVVDNTMTTYAQGDLEGALSMLSEIEALMSGPNSMCRDMSCSNFVFDLIHQLKTLLAFSENLKARIESNEKGDWKPSASTQPNIIDPVEMERVLSPLSSSWRIQIMMLLSKGGNTFAEISRTLDLRTGHLQFHMRSLRGAGYINIDPRSHIYSLTSKGAAALEGVNLLAERVVRP